MVNDHVDYSRFSVLEKVGLGEFLRALDALPVGAPDFEEQLCRLRELYDCIAKSSVL